MIVPAVGVLIASVRGVRTLAEEAAIYLDSAIVTMAVAIALLLGFGDSVAAIGGAGSLLAFVYPMLYLSIAGTGVVALVAIRHPVRPSGGFALIAGCAIVGLGYLGWVVPAAFGAARPGSRTATPCRSGR